jgi:nucleotide-binding universal stress UspA family protein
MTAGVPMTEAPEQGSSSRFVIRRILAAFGPATLSSGALEGAADLAARLGAELEALFVEDTTLLQWTELPFIRQVSLHGLPTAPISPPELELQLRALSADAQNRLAALAAPRRLRWSFRIARGQVRGEVVAAAMGADLLVLGSTSRPFGREALFDPSVRSLIGPVRGPVLLLRAAQPPHGPVHVVIEAADQAGRLLDAAVMIAGTRAAGPVATVWVAEAPLARKLAEEVARARSAVRVQRLSDPAAHEALISAVAGGTLVLSARSSLLERQTWWQDFARGRCALLLVRSVVTDLQGGDAGARD